VTAALAASAEIGVSPTRRGAARSVAFLTPRVGVGEKPNDWARAAAAADTAVIYMGVGEARAITAALLDAGVAPATPVVVVENATLEAQQRFTFTLHNLPRIAEAALTGPAVILLGEVYADVEAQALSASPQVRCA
jgi:siroheme synthase